MQAVTYPQAVAKPAHSPQEARPMPFEPYRDKGSTLYGQQITTWLAKRLDTVEAFLATLDQHTHLTVTHQVEQPRTATIGPNDGALPPEQPADGGWIVGNGSKTKWRSWRDGMPEWVDTPQEATRYYFRSDAQAVHGNDEDAWCLVPYAQAVAENPPEQTDEGLVEHPREKFDHWLFKECNEGTRRHLWAHFGLPVDEIRNHGDERHALRYVLRQLVRANDAALRAELAAAKGDRAGIVAWLRAEFDTYPHGTYQRCSEIQSYWNSAADAIESGADRKDG